MRNYIYKTLIAVIALIVVFEFTIGKTLNNITRQTDILLTKEGRKKMEGGGGNLGGRRCKMIISTLFILPVSCASRNVKTLEKIIIIWKANCFKSLAGSCILSIGCGSEADTISS